MSEDAFEKWLKSMRQTHEVPNAPFVLEAMRASFDGGRNSMLAELRAIEELEAYRACLQFYADPNGECWAACRPQDTAETCCHMIGENSGGEKAREVLKKFGGDNE
jgi:hypothetical protein